LLPFGAGTETIETEVKTKFPELETFRIDSEVTKTKKQAKKILQQFEKSQQACLIVGEKGLHLIREPVSYSAIVSCDSLFELPLLDAERKVFEILLSMESITKKEMLVQVFDTEQPAIEAYQTSTIKKWSESHIQERMHFKYPPLYIHIKYTVSLPYEIQIQQIEHNWKKISAINVQTNIMYHKSKAQYVFIGSAFVERELWNNPGTKRQELLTSLHSFPKTGVYEINPDSLL
jgi:primosomal protein N'